MSDFALFADEDGTAVIIECPRCNGEGRERFCTHYDRDGNECGFEDTCTLCDGRGEIEDEAMPVECDDDLEEMAA